MDDRAEAHRLLHREATPNTAIARRPAMRRKHGRPPLEPKDPPRHDEDRTACAHVIPERLQPEYRRSISTPRSQRETINLAFLTADTSQRTGAWR